MPIPSLQLQKKPVICREAEGLVTELWSPRFVTIQWLCSQLCYVTAANQRTIVEIEILATVSWKWGCRPFSCGCSQNVTHCRKEICCTCMFKASIPTIPSGNSKHPEAWASWELRTFRHLCIRSWLHHAHPFVAAVEKNLSYAQKWLCPRFGLQDIDCALSCAICLLQTSEQLSRLRF